LLGLGLHCRRMQDALHRLLLRFQVPAGLVRRAAEACARHSGREAEDVVPARSGTMTNWAAQLKSAAAGCDPAANAAARPPFARGGGLRARQNLNLQPDRYEREDKGRVR
jgi:hypothetical protein